MQRKITAVICAGAVSLSCVLSVPERVSADDVIEPGSTESFIKWASSTLDYVTGVLSDYDNVAGWAYDTYNYACDIAALCNAYSAWFDDQSPRSGDPPVWETIFGWAKISDSTKPGGYYVAGVAGKGVTNSGSTYYSAPGGFTPLSGNVGFMSYAGVGGKPIFAWASNVSTVSLGSSVTVNGSFVEASPWQASYQSNGFAVDFYYNINSDIWSYQPGSTYYHIAAYTPVEHRNPATRTNPIYCTGKSDLLRLFDVIDEDYPDRDEDALPDIIPPEPDAQVEEHPDGCICICHVEVNVTVTNDFSGLLEGGSSLNAGTADDLGIDPDAAFNALDELNFDAVQTESMKAGMGLIWALFSKFAETTGIFSFIMVCMLVVLLMWFFGRAL